MASRTPTKRRRAPQKRAEETRQHLLDTAVKLFTSVGFEGTTSAAIEEAAEVQRGLLAYHFGSKDALWRAAVDYTFVGFETRAIELFEQELAVRDNDALAALIAAYIRSGARYPEPLDFIVREAKVSSSRREYIAQTHVSRFAGMISNVSGRPANVHDFYIVVGAMSFAFVAPAAGWQIWDIDPFSEEFVEGQIEAAIDLFRKGWAQQAPTSQTQE